MKSKTLSNHIFYVYRILAIHEMARKLGSKTCKALPFCHAFTGCDSVSYFHYHGKRKAFETWKVMPEVTELFIRLGTEGKNSLAPDDLDLLTRFVIVMYSRSSPYKDLSKARHALFIEGRSIESLPPTQGALIQHCYRAIFQAYIWIHCTELNPCELNPSLFGWKKHLDMWQPFWTDQPHICAALQKLGSCHCKVRCSGNCKCFTYGFPCSAACKCSVSTNGCPRIQT